MFKIFKAELLALGVFLFIVNACSGFVEGDESDQETSFSSHASSNTVINQTTGNTTSETSTTTTVQTSSVTSTTLVGVFVDALVSGLTYHSQNLSGSTDSNGSFAYTLGDTITFSIGGITLGSTNGQSILTPIDVSGAADENDQRVINMVRLLQTLDNDGEQSNGIEITTATRMAASSFSVDFNQPLTSFESALANSLTLLTSLNSVPQTSLKDAAEALKNFKGQLTSNGQSTVKSAPLEISISSLSVDEGTASGSTIATLASTNANDGSSLSNFSLLSQSLAGAFQLSQNHLQVADSNVIDFETASTNTNVVEIRVTDADNLTFDQMFTITISDINEAPKGISLAGTTYVQENQAAGVVLGTLFVTGDPDAGDTGNSFSLVSGTGSDNNASFNISSNQLSTAASFDFESLANKSIRVQAADNSGSTVEQVFNIEVGNDTSDDPIILFYASNNVIPETDFSSISTADSLCQTQSTSVSTASGKTIISFLSDDNTDLKDRVNSSLHENTVYGSDGSTVVMSSWTALLTLDIAVSNTIQDAVNNLSDPTEYWTGTRTTGTGFNARNCNNWSQNSATGLEAAGWVGVTNAAFSGSVKADGFTNCNTANVGLLCVAY